MFRTKKFITRFMLRAEPATLFVFGDNMKGTGYGGQAAQMRGEPNAIGIPTKWLPSMAPKSFFTDDDFPIVSSAIQTKFKILAEHLAKGGDVVWPEDNIGTGRAQLPTRAPQIFALVEQLRKELESRYSKK